MATKQKGQFIQDKRANKPSLMANREKSGFCVEKIKKLFLYF